MLWVPLALSSPFGRGACLGPPPHLPGLLGMFAAPLFHAAGAAKFAAAGLLKLGDTGQWFATVAAITPRQIGRLKERDEHCLPPLPGPWPPAAALSRVAGGIVGARTPPQPPPADFDPGEGSHAIPCDFEKVLSGIKGRCRRAGIYIESTYEYLLIIGSPPIILT